MTDFKKFVSPNFAVGFRSSLALLVLLVVDGAGDACLFPL